jgi:hypothetical protein
VVFGGAGLNGNCSYSADDAEGNKADGEYGQQDGDCSRAIAIISVTGMERSFFIVHVFME